MEVYQQSDFASREPKVSQKNCIVDRCEGLDSLELDNHVLVHENIDPIATFELQAFVNHRQRLLLLKGNVAFPQLLAEAFLICRLKEPRAQDLVHLYRRPDDRVSEFLIGHGLPQRRGERRD